MPAVTFSKAAKLLGFKSRSTLYRLHREGRLANYVLPPESTGGAERLELAPSGIPPLREHVARCVRPQLNNGERRNGNHASEGWDAVAVSLAREVEGLPLLTGGQLEAVALRLPAAIREALGPDGLEAMRTALVAAGCWWAGMAWPHDQATSRRWWGLVGRWAPTVEDPCRETPPAEAWELVAGHLSAMCDLPPMTPVQAEEIHDEIHEALADFRIGARWDQAQYDRFLAGELYQDEVEGDQPISDGQTKKALREVLYRGLIDTEILDKIRSALEAAADISKPGEMP